MSNSLKRTKMIGFAVTTALASATLAGCAGNAAPEARVSAAKAEQNLERGKASKAVSHAEAAVLAEPRNVAHRVMLGAAYLEDGRFVSAETSFAEAMELGSTDSRIVVSRALAQIAIGRSEDALILLKDWQDAIDPADLGLAFALAGEPGRGVHVLGNALRSGQDTSKIRQNLAYAFALNGDWRDARLMAANDVPADQLGDRMSEWASHTLPGAYTARVAGLLGVEVQADPGRPVMLALDNNLSVPQMAAEVSGDSELPAVPERDLPPALAGLPASMKAQEVDIAPLTPVELANNEFMTPAQPVEQVAIVTPVAKAPALQAPTPKAPVMQTPVRTARAAATVVTPSKRLAPSNTSAAAQLADGEHYAQLGSFYTEADAKRAWKIFQSRYAALADKQMVITKAKVRGKLYYRVSAADLAASSAQALCSTVKDSGHGCFAYSADRPLPGALDRVIRVARLS